MSTGVSEGRPNKSARKREIEALHTLAEKMLGLSDKELAGLDVPIPLREALDQVRPMRVSGARNRQLKHCVKLMNMDELEQVAGYLQDRQSQRVAMNQSFHMIETWRDRLIDSGDEALSAFFDQHPGLERQPIRQLCRDAARERENGKPAGAGRKLFRYLREQVFDDNA